MKSTDRRRNLIQHWSWGDRVEIYVDSKTAPRNGVTGVNPRRKPLSHVVFTRAPAIAYPAMRRFSAPHPR